MSDEAIEIIAGEVAKVNCNAIDDRMVAERIRDALRSEGFQVYRHDECETVEVEDGGAYADYHTGEPQQAEPFLHGPQVQETRCRLALGTYRLVPVPAESEEG